MELRFYRPKRSQNLTDSRFAGLIREHLPAHVELDELIANGMLGLLDAFRKFDSSKRVKMQSYARHRVRGAILDGLRGADPASRDLRRTNKRVQSLYRKLEADFGRPVEDEEIAKAMGVNLEQLHQTLNDVQTVGFNVGSRAMSAGPNTKRTTAEPELLADDDADPFDRCYRLEQREMLGRALSHLREREREIITLHYQQKCYRQHIACYVLLFVMWYRLPFAVVP